MFVAAEDEKAWLELMRNPTGKAAKFAAKNARDAEGKGAACRHGPACEAREVGMNEFRGSRVRRSSRTVDLAVAVADHGTVYVTTEEFRDYETFCVCCLERLDFMFSRKEEHPIVGDIEDEWWGEIRAEALSKMEPTNREDIVRVAIEEVEALDSMKVIARRTRKFA